MVFGGEASIRQMMKLRGAGWRRRRDVCPPNIKNAVKLDQIEILVPMKPTALDMGFIHDICCVLAKLP
ncbi:hypothetical protein KCP73_03225 [Salmonella enterica subsp. enterica]|nr:hypothetical protein KCP73_03225 [Salmonella enterica subsp. enterica]